MCQTATKSQDSEWAQDSTFTVVESGFPAEGIAWTERISPIFAHFCKEMYRSQIESRSFKSPPVSNLKEWERGASPSSTEVKFQYYYSLLENEFYALAQDPRWSLFLPRGWMLRREAAERLISGQFGVQILFAGFQSRPGQSDPGPLGALKARQSPFPIGRFSGARAPDLHEGGQREEGGHEAVAGPPDCRSPASRRRRHGAARSARAGGARQLVAQDPLLSPALPPPSPTSLRSAGHGSQLEIPGSSLPIGPSPARRGVRVGNPQVTDEGMSLRAPGSFAAEIRSLWVEGSLFWIAHHNLPRLLSLSLLCVLLREGWVGSNTSCVQAPTFRFQPPHSMVLKEARRWEIQEAEAEKDSTN